MDGLTGLASFKRDSNYALVDVIEFLRRTDEFADISGSTFRQFVSKRLRCLWSKDTTNLFTNGLQVRRSVCLFRLLTRRPMPKDTLELCEVKLEKDLDVYSEEDVDVERAANLLLSSDGNRALSPSKCDAYCRDMESGNFQLTAPLAIDVDGRLKDGHHRLFAVLTSQTTQKFRFIRNYTQEQVVHIDRGRPRSVSDQFAFSDSTRHYSAEVVSVVRLIVLLKGHAALSDNEVRSWLLKHDAAVRKMIEITSIKHAPRGAPIRVAVLLGLMANEVRASQRWFELVCGTAMTSDEVSYIGSVNVYRHYLSSPKRSGDPSNGPVSQTNHAKRACNSLFSFCKKKSLKDLKMAEIKWLHLVDFSEEERE